MTCFARPFPRSVENGGVERGYVVDVDAGPHIQPFPGDSSLSSGEVGFDEKRDLHGVWVLDAE